MTLDLDAHTYDLLNCDEYISSTYNMYLITNYNTGNRIINFTKDYIENYHNINLKLNLKS